MQKLTVDPTFRDLIPPLSDAEFIQLEKNIVRDGRVNEPLTVWNSIIIDGHHRYKIIQKHPEIPYTAEERVFTDKWAAVSWACDRQLGRRNITEEQKAYLRGRLYEAEKMVQGAPQGNKNWKSQSGQNVQFNFRKEQQAGTAGRIGKQYGVDGRTIRRDADFAKGLDAADKVSPGFKDAVLTGSVKAPKSTIAAIDKLDEPTQKKAVEAIQSGENVKITGTGIKMTNAEIKAFLSQNGSDVPYNNDDLKEELDCVIRTFRNNFTSTLTIHEYMLSDADAQEKVKAALSEAEAAIQEIRSLIR